MNTARKYRPRLAALLWLSAPMVLWAGQDNESCDQVPTVIESVRVFDGKVVIPRAHVILRCKKISRIVVNDSLNELPEGSHIVNGAGKTLMPGLFESHGHTFKRDMLERSLDFGVTTVLDMGSTNPDFVRNIKAEDDIGQATDRADLFSAVLWVTAPGSHGTQFGEVPTLTRPEDAEAFIAQRVKDGADFIKIIYDNFKMIDRPVPTLSKETMFAAVKAAHAQQKIAVVHSRDLDAYADVIEAGADGFVHTPVDARPGPDVIGGLIEKDIYVGPNLSLMRPLGNRLINDPIIGPMLNQSEIENLGKFFAMHREGGEVISEDTVTLLYEAGATLIAGSDSPNAGTAVGASMHLELEMLVDVGLSPVDALRAATANPAEVFGIDDRGRVAEGFLADLLLVEGKPDENIADTRRLHTIWKAGIAHSGPVAGD